MFAIIKLYPNSHSWREGRRKGGREGGTEGRKIERMKENQSIR